MSKQMRKPLVGVIPPMITPLKSENKLDYSGLEKVIDHILAGGVHGLFLLGTTGEGPSLSVDLKYEMVKKSCEIIDKRVPVLVGITDTSFSESIRLAEYAAECAADAVVLAPPYYFPAGQAELLEYLEHLAPKLPLPMFLYNMPAMTKINIEVDTLKQAAQIDGIIGFKDSSGNMIRFHEYVRAMRDNPEFSLLMGPEELLAESVLFGGHGGVCGGANIKPDLFVALYNAAKSQNMGEILSLQHELFTLRRMYSCGKYASSFIKGVKCALSCMNVCDDFMAEPFHAFRENERKSIQKYLTECGIDSL
jgi:4-hydroxy-tetrahydrodipicolinate synthase